MVELDNLHFDFREVDGYNKPFTVAISPREPGKTVALWRKKIFANWQRDFRPWIILTRTAAEITDAALSTIQDANINKFLPDDQQIKFKYNRGDFKTGIVDVFISDKLFFRMVSLSIPLRRIKLAVVRGARGMAMDEYIIDPRSGERYVQNEGFKILEAFTTWRRECPDNFRAYFIGNPYSLYNPLFDELRVDTRKLKRGEITRGNIWVIQWATLKPELREKLLRENPLYTFDEEYTNYALNGIAVNDSNIPINKTPCGFYLHVVIHTEEKYIGLFRNPVPAASPSYHVEELARVSVDRTVWSFDVRDVVRGTVLIDQSGKSTLSLFKTAMARNDVTFSSVSVYYKIVEVFKLL